MNRVMQHETLQHAVDTVADTVKSTLGPKGRQVVVGGKRGAPTITSDGATISREMRVEGILENYGADLVREVATATGSTVGDGTTTATVLAQAIVDQGLQQVAAGAHPLALGRGIERAVDQVVKNIRAQAKEVEGRHQIARIAASSAGDDEIGEVIADAIETVGKDGVIAVEEGQTFGIELDLTEGMQFGRGYISRYMVTDQALDTAVLQDPYVLPANHRIRSVRDVLPVLEQVAQSGKPLLIVAEDVDGEALAALVVNKLRGTFQVVAVKAPGFGDRRERILEDIAILTGGEVIADESDDPAADLSQLGRARRVVVTNETTTIIEGHGDPDAIRARMDEIRTEMDKTDSDFDREKLRERLGQLAGVAVLKVGGATEKDLQHRKRRVEDALQTTRAALEEGVLPGGGVALLSAATAVEVDSLSGDERTGASIIVRALEEPARQLARNAGLDASAVVEDVRQAAAGHGLNVETGDIVNLESAGIIDPAMVTRSALENAASVAKGVLTTAAVVVDPSGMGHEEPPDDPDDVGYRRIGIWIAEREKDPKRPLEADSPYTLCVRVGDRVEASLVSGPNSQIPLEDVPEDGLDTTWTLESATVRFTSLDESVETSTHVVRGTLRWSARFALTIPRGGDSDLVRMVAEPLATGESSIEVAIEAQAELYRRLNVGVQVVDAQPVAVAGEQSTTVAAEDSVSVREDHELAPMRQLGLEPAAAWQRAPGTVRIRPVDKISAWASGNMAAGDVVPERPYGWYVEKTNVGEWVAAVRMAARDVSGLFAETLSDVDPDDLQKRLDAYRPPERWSELDDAADSPHTARWNEMAGHEKLRDMARTGAGLYDRFFPKEEGSLRKIIDALEPGHRISVTWTQQIAGLEWIAHIPWGLMYLGDPDDDIDPTMFMGLRFRIDYMAFTPKAVHRETTSPDLAHQATCLYWGHAADDAVAVESQWHHEHYAGSQYVFVPSDPAHARKADLLSFLKKPEPTPMPVIYMFCHLDSHSGGMPTLRFGNNSADVVRRIELPTSLLADAPIMFINACDSAASDVHRLNELEEWCFSSGCRAFLGTECKVPPRLASRFAAIFFHFFQRQVDGTPVAAGEAAAQARLFLWSQYRNLGGLMYSYINQSQIYLADRDEVSRLWPGE